MEKSKNSKNSNTVDLSIKQENVKSDYKKQDIRALWIIYILSDGQKHKQKEIKELFN